jgi:hypothetical protein
VLLASGFLLGVAGLIRPAALFAFPAWLLYLAWRRIGWRPLGAGVLAFVLPLLIYAGVHQRVTGQFGLIDATGWFLYGRVGEIAAPCGKAEIPATGRRLCERRGNKEEGHAFYIWQRGSPARRLFGGPDDGSQAHRRRANGVLTDFALAVVRDRPADYGEVVMRDFGRYFVPGERTGDRAENLPTAPEVTLADPFARRVVRRYIPGYVAPTYDPGAFLVRLEYRLHTPRWLLAFLAFCPLAAAVMALVRRGRGDAGRTAEAVFLGATGLLVLLGSAATSGFVLRYLIPEVPLLVCGGVLALHELTGGRYPVLERRLAAACARPAPDLR